jgi:hypothetical protein
MHSKAKTVAAYLAELTPDRRETMEVLRRKLKRHLDPLLEEVLQYGMITYVIPHRVYPPGYHCRPTDPLPFLSVASQKNNLALYVMAISMDRQLSTWLDQAWKATGHRLDRGQSCIRFRSPDDIPWDVLAELLQKVDVPTYVQLYEQSRGTAAQKPGTSPQATGAGKAANQPRRGKTTPPAQAPPATQRRQTATGSAAGKKNTSTKPGAPTGRVKKSATDNQAKAGPQPRGTRRSRPG